MIEKSCLLCYSRGTQNCSNTEVIMAFDGLTTANITKQLQETLTGGRIYKIAQPESDELLLTIKNNGT